MFINNMFVPTNTTQVRELTWLNYCDVLDVVRDNMHLFNSMYRGGCGYDNFATLFQNIAMQITGVKDSDKLNWDKFDDRWCDMLDYTNHPLFISLRLHFKTKTINPHYKILTDLLHDLCQVT